MISQQFLGFKNLSFGGGIKGFGNAKKPLLSDIIAII
jgi:hypothetical protein